VAFGEALASVRKRDVKLDHQVPVARLVDGSVRAVASLDDTRERERSKLAFRVALLDAGPNGRALRRVFTEGKRVEEAEASRIGDSVERRRGTLVLFVARALEQRGVAREEVQVPVFDRHFATALNPAYDSAVVALRYILHECRMWWGRQSAAAGAAATRSAVGGDPPPAMAFNATAATTSAAPPSMRTVTGSPSQKVPIMIASAGTIT
jgi:hypothetical protein